MDNRAIGGLLKWAENAGIDIPKNPTPGTAYRKSDMSPEDFQRGQQYLRIGESSEYNQALWLLSTLLQECEKYGIMRWSPLTDYPQNAFCLGTDGKLYQAIAPSGPSSSSGPLDPATDTDETYWLIFSSGGGGDGTIELSDEPGNILEKFSDGYYVPEEVAFFDHMPTQDEIDQVPNQALVVIPSDVPAEPPYVVDVLVNGQSVVENGTAAVNITAQAIFDNQQSGKPVYTNGNSVFKGTSATAEPTDEFATLEEIQEAQTSGAIYLGQLKYGADTQITMNALTSVIDGDLCFCSETQKTYAYANDAWAEAATQPPQAIGNYYDLVLWCGTWQGVAHIGDVSASVKWSGTNWDLLVYSDVVIDGSVTDDKIGSRNIGPSTPDADMLGASAEELQLMPALNKIADNLSWLRLGVAQGGGTVQNFYVSTSGVDSVEDPSRGLSTDNAWATIQYAVTQISTHPTINQWTILNVGAGTYAFTNTLEIQGFTNLYIRGAGSAPGETILDFSGSIISRNIRIRDNANIRIENLKVQGYSVDTTAHDIHILNVNNSNVRFLNVNVQSNSRSCRVLVCENSSRCILEGFNVMGTFARLAFWIVKKSELCIISGTVAAGFSFIDGTATGTLIVVNEVSNVYVGTLSISGSGSITGIRYYVAYLSRLAYVGNLPSTSNAGTTATGGVTQ